MARQDEEISRRQHRDRNAHICKAMRNLSLSHRRQSCEFRRVANRDPPTKPVARRELGHKMCIETRGIVTGIDMHVDINVILARDFEDPIDLTRMIDIVIGSRADDACAMSRPWRSAVSTSGAVVMP